MEVELGDALRRGGRVRKPALTKAQRAEDAAVREELACDTGVAGKAGDAVDVAAETLATRESLREPVAPAADVDAVSIGSSDSDSDEVDESDIGAWESVSETAPLACATCGQSEPPVSMTHTCGKCGRPNHPWCGTDAEDGNYKSNCKPFCKFLRPDDRARVRTTGESASIGPAAQRYLDRQKKPILFLDGASRRAKNSAITAQRKDQLHGAKKPAVRTPVL